MISKLESMQVKDSDENMFTKKREAKWLSKQEAVLHKYFKE